MLILGLGQPDLRFEFQAMQGLYLKEMNEKRLFYRVGTMGDTYETKSLNTLQSSNSHREPQG